MGPPDAVLLLFSVRQILSLWVIALLVISTLSIELRCGLRGTLLELECSLLFLTPCRFCLRGKYDLLYIRPVSTYFRCNLNSRDLKTIHTLLF